MSRNITKREMENLARIATATGTVAEIVKPDGTVFRINPASSQQAKLPVDLKPRRII
jgi:hypothetical protein